MECIDGGLMEGGVMTYAPKQLGKSSVRKPPPPPPANKNQLSSQERMDCDKAFELLKVMIPKTGMHVSELVEAAETAATMVLTIKSVIRNNREL